ncbi:ATP-binding protein [Lysinibacillus parviboronicapiens]|uniref:ATP-binding protein n=1 Tax=Lysinibacillus parviboronicapiens TaxID=436516 RepID=UPI000D3D9DEB|nr:ATP-binding protein [Lysinibacillus parviboronicapiens]
MMNEKRKILVLQFIFLTAHLFLIFTMLSPYIGIAIHFNSNEEVVVTNVYDNDGWARYTNLSPGDVILEVDDKEISSIKTYNYNNCFVHGSSIKIKRNNEMKYIQAPTNSLKDTFQEIIIPSIFSLTVFVLTLFIYQQNSKVAFYLIGFLLSVSLSFFASTESGRGDIVSSILICVFFPLGSLFLTLFIHRLLLEKGIIKNKWLTFFKINSVICLFVIFLKLATLLQNNLLDVISTGLMLSYFCLNICFSIMLLLYFYVATKGSHHEVFFKWLILIHVCAFIPFIFLHAVPFIFNLPYLQDDVAAFTLFIIPIGYSYIVLTNRLIDINFILKQIPYYTFLTFIPTLVLTILVISDRFYTENGVVYFIILFLAILIINIVTLFLKEKLDFQLKDSFLYKQSYLSKNLNEFSQKLPSVMKENDLENLLLNQITEILDPQILLLIRLNKETLEFQSIDYKSNSQSMLTDFIKKKLKNTTTDTLIGNPNYLGIELYQTDSYVTYLWVSQKRNNTTFNMHEKMWLINIVKYVRLVHENLNIVQNIIKSIEKRDTTNHQSSNTLSRFLLQLGEQERIRLASDLHDSALQDQTIWYQKLDKVIQNSSSTLQEEELATLNKIKNGLLDVIKQLRETCSELRPNFMLNTDFTASLEEFCKKKQMKVSYNLKYEFHNFSDYSNNYNLTISIYRVLQELLNNAEKHAKASVVSVEMWEENDYIFLDYKDNGVGMNNSIEKYSEHHIGLIGIKERIHILNGDIEFISEVNKGLQILITIPR